MPELVIAIFRESSLTRSIPRLHPGPDEHRRLGEVRERDLVAVQAA